MKESHSSRLLVLAGFLAVILLLYTGVLFDTQVTHHQEYLTQSLHSIAREERINASRGIITDRMGRPLVTNGSVYNLTFDASLLEKDQDPNVAILRLLQLCRAQNKAWADHLPISTEAPYTYHLETLSDIQQRRFLTYLRSIDEAEDQMIAYLLEHPELAVDPEAKAAKQEEAPPEDPPKHKKKKEDALSPEAQGRALLEKMPLSSFTSDFLNSAGLSPQRVLYLMKESLKIPSSFSPADARAVIGVRYELALRRLVNCTDYVMVENVDTPFISIINDGHYDGAKITSSPVRQYETTYAAHLLGTVTRIYAEDMERLAGKGYDGNDWIGRSGVEAAFEDYLKGTDGRRIISTNSEGKITGEFYETEPKPGNTVELTIDLELQKAVEDALAETVSAMNRKDGMRERGAAVVVEKVNTGEILAMASYPTYNLSTYHQDIAELSENPGKPLQNRATQGAYAPGSTFKMVTAVAALEEGAVSLHEHVRDTGRWHYPDIVEGTVRWGYNCWKRSGHGNVDVVDAITVSCNTFFYEMGYRLGIDKLSKWAAAFGLGEPTGLEIGDRAGILASREEREAKGGVWYGGDTVMAAIGQSDHLFTPVQLSNYICTLLSGGDRHETHLLKAVKTHDNSEVVAIGDSKPISSTKISDSTLAAVKKGMLGLTTTGGLSSYFKNCIVSAGAKTGTAQLGEKKTNNGVFVCFAPYEDPEIAVSIVIEKGGSGSALASTAVKILNAYFSSEEIGTVILPENQLLP